MIEVLAIVTIIVNILVYFKLPEFLQTIISKRFDKRLAELQIDNEEKLNQIQLDFQREYQKIEQEFTSKLEVYKKRYSVLPELYKVITEFEAAVEQLDMNTNNREIINRFALAKNYRAINQFYLNETLSNTSNECILGIFDYYIAKVKLKDCAPELIDVRTKEVDELKKLKETYISKLDQEIKNIMWE